MIEASAHRHVTIAGRRLEVVTIPGSPALAPIVMLHEGLGSVSAWREFPAELAARTARTVVAYSRYGYGSSDVLAGAHGVDYMHREGEVVLPALIAALGLAAPVLFGHSDGASIALICGGKHPDLVHALVLEAPHVFVEPVTVASIARVKATVDDSGLIEKLGRHHADPAKTFWGWNDIWLHPPFLDWDITAYLPAITAPVLLIQGRDDEYGTLAQLDAIARAVPQAQSLVLETSGHSPHRTQKAAVLERTATFLAELA